MGKGYEVGNNLCVRSRLEYGTVILELLLDNPRIGKVPIMSNGEISFRVFYDEGLSIAKIARTGSRIPYMSDGRGTLKFCQDICMKDIGDEPHFPMRVHCIVVGACDTGALLSSMLKGVKPQISHICRVFMIKNSEYAAHLLSTSFLFLHFINEITDNVLVN